MSFRKFGVLLRQLPRTSRTVQESAGERARWGDTEHILAGIFDSLEDLGWRITLAHFKGMPRHPEPLPRPGEQRETGRRIGGEKVFTREALDALLARARPKRG